MISIYYFLFGTLFNIGDMSLIITDNFYSTDLIVLIVVLSVVPGDFLFRSLARISKFKNKIRNLFILIKYQSNLIYFDHESVWNGIG